MQIPIAFACFIFPSCHDRGMLAVSRNHWRDLAREARYHVVVGMQSPARVLYSTFFPLTHRPPPPALEHPVRDRRVM